MNQTIVIFFIITGVWVNAEMDAAIIIINFNITVYYNQEEYLNPGGYVVTAFLLHIH